MSQSVNHMDQRHAEDLALLRRVAVEAGGLARPFWRATPKVWEKPDGGGPVSEADLAVDAMMKERLLAARPDYGWLSEETEDDPARLKSGRVFIIDPIDGTRAFLNGEDTWAHSLAVAEGGEITSAVIYLPMLNLTYTASRGLGARLNGRPLVLGAHADRAASRDLTGATVLTHRDNMQGGFWQGGVPAVIPHFRPSLAYRMALVAEGKFDAMLSLRRTWEWDVAAGTLIMNEAGGQVSNRHGAPVRYNQSAPAHDGLIAGPGAVQGLLLAHLAAK